MHWTFLAGALIVGTAGQLLLKMGAVGPGGFLEQLFRPATLGGLVCYGLAAMLYIVALRGIPVSIAFPAAASQYVIVGLFAWLVLHEPWTLQQAAGLGLIVLGVALLATSH
ncbi:EamA family transporter [Elioraea thermophila]|uniref:EamA family transporter n=1 Tax=Elioraea thermophila TaxID=2185104 RepID=UPI000DF3ABDF|nr:EamA family transporter [Elioraea thermophila]